MSLSAVASPRAWEPNRKTCAGAAASSASVRPACSITASVSTRTRYLRRRRPTDGVEPDGARTPRYTFSSTWPRQAANSTSSTRSRMRRRTISAPYVRQRSTRGSPREQCAPGRLLCSGASAPRPARSHQLVIHDGPEHCGGQSTRSWPCRDLRVSADLSVLPHPHVSKRPRSVLFHRLSAFARRRSNPPTSASTNENLSLWRTSSGRESHCALGSPSREPRAHSDLNTIAHEGTSSSTKARGRSAARQASRRSRRDARSRSQRAPVRPLPSSLERGCMRLREIDSVERRGSSRAASICRFASAPKRASPMGTE